MTFGLGSSTDGRLKAATGASTAFRELRRNLARNTLRSLLTEARLRLVVVLVCSAIFWTGLYLLFAESFEFLGTFLPLSNEIVEYVFSLFFLSLLVMLFFSTAILLYGGLFQSREVEFLLTTPADADRIFAYKFFEAMAFSSWGFFLLGSPLLIAYGAKAHAPWPFFVVFPAYLLAFASIPGGLGAIGALAVANLFPRRKWTALAVTVGVCLAAAGALGVRLWKTPGEALSREWIDALLSRLSFSQHPLLPSRWMSRGLLETARGRWSEGLFYLGVLTSHAAMAFLLAGWTAWRCLRRGFSRVQGGRSGRRRNGGEAFDNAFHRIFGPWISRPIRLLLLKDLRTFVRDPTQWSQFLIFFGLLAFYFGNIPRLGYHVESPYFRNLLAFLNLSVTALILSTFTSRFIFPMLSLEGRNFWLLGLFPVSRESILWGKFVFSTGIALVATETLVLLSDVMLRLTPAVIALHVGVVAILCLGLSGISVGLGARLANLKEDDPSKIAAGFGGTLNLLVSLLFIAMVGAAVALTGPLLAGNGPLEEFGGRILANPPARNRVFGAFLICLVLGTLATVIPLRLGIQALRKMEF